MIDTPIDPVYNRDLESFEQLLVRVQRPGDFFAHGSLEVPMPRVAVDGVGVLSFPVPQAQVRDVIAQCERAPYGRGEETVLDTSVRKVWQLAPSKFTVGGKSWPRTFEQILSAAAAGLGCAGANVSAELYKLLVYDNGAFFRAHRDTEKTDGMFGTLLLVLPSPHQGGELVLRHAGREVTLGLSGTEVSELTFAAFYADCEHEVLPVTIGHRVCLVYNLLQKRRKGKGRKPQPLVAPDYAVETTAAAELLEQTFAHAEAPAKIAWLLEHEYSPAGLSFAALKSADAARANLLAQAASRADCALHLGIVHIEDYGAAEYWGDGPGPFGRSSWHWYADDGEEHGYECETDDFEIIEVLDGRRYVDHWIDVNDAAAGFGELPLEDAELLPAGALDGAAPDEQRVMEATGNEGASFERFYHRAALVIWPRRRFVGVLLQAGPQAAVPYLERRVAACTAGSRAEAERLAVLAEARRVVEAWESAGGPEMDAFADDDDDDYDDYDDDDEYDVFASEVLLGDDELGTAGTDGGSESDAHARMITVLGQVGDADLLERFVSGTVTSLFDGGEAPALAEAAPLLGAKRCGALLSRLVRRNMHIAPGSCVELLGRLAYAEHARWPQGWAAALREIGAAVVEGLPDVRRGPARAQRWSGAGTSASGSVDADVLADLLDLLTALGAPWLREAACEAAVENGEAFDVPTVIVPALGKLRERGRAVSGDAEAKRLWLHAADVLLERSEHPPAPPRDWRRQADVSCDCIDCRELEAFAADPVEQTHRFCVRTDRRRHLHEQIRRHGLDMTHVTERKGRPYTLVCTKTRWSYERRCEAYRLDIAGLAALADVLGEPPSAFAVHSARIAAARERETDWAVQRT